MSLFQKPTLFLASQSFCQKAQIQPTMLSTQSYYLINMPTYVTHHMTIHQTYAYNYEFFVTMPFFSTHKDLPITHLNQTLSIINKL